MAFNCVRAAFHALYQPGCTLSAPQRLVLLTVADHINRKSQQAWPSQERLAETTGLSRSSINRCLLELEKQGYLARKWRGGHMTTLYRVDVAKLKSFYPNGVQPDEEDDEATGEHHPPVVSQGHTHCVTETHNSGTVVSQGDTILGIKQNPGMIEGVALECSNAPVPQSDINPKSHGKKTKMKLPKGLSVATIVSKQKSEYLDLSDEQVTAVSKVNGRFTADGLKHVWRRAHGKYVEGFCPEVTIKEAGQLVLAYKRVGDAIPQLILLVMKNWVAFVKQAEKEAGAFKLPTKPSIPHFLKYVEVAMSLALTEEVPDAPAPVKAKKAAPAKSVQMIAPAPTPSTTLSPADLADIEVD